MSVKAFFDESSEGYDGKYSKSGNRHLEHFFMDRLRQAVAGLTFANRTVWDIGAGTGQLYRYLADTSPSVDYRAVDISPGMLRQSPIPADRQYVGTFPEVAVSVADHSVDYFFMLGVTTYMTDAEVSDTLAAMRQKAAPGALAILTITNRTSVEWLLQKTASRVLRVRLIGRMFRSKNRVAGQDFFRNAMTLDHLVRLLPPQAKVVSVFGLNQTFTPANRLVPTMSQGLERLIRSVSPGNSRLRHLLSSDILVRIAFDA